MRTSNALFLALLVGLAGCASSTSDPPASTWDERQERIDEQNEELAQRERAEQQAERTEAQRAGDANRAEPRAEVRDSNTNAVPSNSPGASPDSHGIPSAQSDGSVEKRSETADARALVTPLDQGNDKRDLEITQQIRKSVMDDSTLSFTAKNVKIITKDGHVTLRGPVPSGLGFPDVPKSKDQSVTPR